MVEIHKPTFHIDKASSFGIFRIKYTKEFFEEMLRKGQAAEIALRAQMFFKIAAEIAISRTVPDISPNAAMAAAQGVFRTTVSILERTRKWVDAEQQVRDLLTVVDVFDLGPQAVLVAVGWNEVVGTTTKTGTYPKDVIYNLGVQAAQRSTRYRNYMNRHAHRERDDRYRAEHFSEGIESIGLYESKLKKANEYHSALCAHMAVLLAQKLGLGQKAVEDALALVRRYLQETSERLLAENKGLVPYDYARRAEIENELNLLGKYLPPLPPPPR